MARYPASKKTLALRGSRQKRKHRTAATPRGTPVMPSWLPAGAKAEWRRVVPILKSAYLLSRLDLGILASYCVAVDELRKLTEALERDGLLVTQNGQTYPNPLLKVRGATENRIKSMSMELGLTPMVRRRGYIEVDQEEEVDELSQFMMNRPA